jgi:hypothetical protein
MKAVLSALAAVAVAVALVEPAPVMSAASELLQIAETR